MCTDQLMDPPPTAPNTSLGKTAPQPHRSTFDSSGDRDNLGLARYTYTRRIAFPKTTPNLGIDYAICAGNGLRDDALTSTMLASTFNLASLLLITGLAHSTFAIPSRKTCARHCSPARICVCPSNPQTSPQTCQNKLATS